MDAPISPGSQSRIPPSEFSLQFLQNVDRILSNEGGGINLREKLLAEIDYLPQLSIELHKRLNACRPLIKLPQDIQRKIMFSLADVWSPTAPKCCGIVGVGSDSKNPLGWITISHVSTALRQLVFETRQLWARWNSALPNAQEEMIRRAGDCPIVLRGGGSNCLHVRSRAAAMSAHAHLAKLIDISNDHWPLDPAILCRKELPFLEELRLRCAQNSHQERLIVDYAFELPSIRAPVLRRLICRNSFIPFNPTTLSYLNLSRTSQRVNISPPQLLDTLRSCETLQELNLDGIIPDLEPASQANINLRSLLSLFLSDTMPHINALRSHLVLPPAATRTYELHISEDAELIPGNEYFNVLEASFQADFNLPNIWGLLACFRNDKRFDFEFYTSDIEKDDVIALAQPLSLRGQLGIYMVFAGITPGPAHFQSAASFLFHHVSLSEVKYTELLFNSPLAVLSQEEWMSLLRPLPNVRTLALNVRASKSILPALKAIAMSDDKPIFPFLENIWIDKASFMDAGSGSGSSFSYDAFIRVLLSRKHSATPLKVLSIGGFAKSDDVDTVHQVWMPRLQAIVPEVRVAGLLSPDRIRGL